MEVIATMLHVLDHHGNIASQDVFHRLFHSVTFCHPNSRILEILSTYLLRQSRLVDRIDFLNLLCCKSNYCVSIKKMYNKIQYTAETCTMQMFAALIQTEYGQYVAIEDPHELHLLCQTTTNILLFLRNCWLTPVHWVLKQQKQQNTEFICDCYVNLVCASVVLLHLCLKQWIDFPMSLGTCSFFLYRYDNKIFSFQISLKFQQ